MTQTDHDAAQRRHARIEAMREAQQVESWVRRFVEAERAKTVKALTAMERPSAEELLDRQKDLRWLDRLERRVNDAIAAGKRALEEKT